MVAGSASGSASSAGPSSDGGGDGGAHWRALQPGSMPTLKSMLSSTLFYAEAAVGALQARNLAGDWVNIDPVPGAFVCMSTMRMLHFMSAGRCGESGQPARQGGERAAAVANG